MDKVGSLRGSPLIVSFAESRERSPTLDRIHDGRLDLTGEVEGIDRLVVPLDLVVVVKTSGLSEGVRKRETDRGGSEDTWSF